MRVQFLLSSVFVASAFADLNERFVEGYGAIAKRQQFKPTTTTAEGSTCADAFGPGYVTCREAGSGKNRLCYNPDLGQTCCSNNWACPAGSFCLVGGSCCPNGQSPQTCANNNGVTISSDFQVPTAAPLSGNSTGSGSSSKPTQSSNPNVKSGTPAQAQNYQLAVLGVGLVGAVLGALVIL